MVHCQTPSANGGDRQTALVLNGNDDVAVALVPLRAGTQVQVGGRPIQIVADVPMGHKVALRDVERGNPIRKYGEVIGYATQDLVRGEWVHTHNLAAGSVSRPERVRSAAGILKSTGPEQCFLGYRREDGRVGTRNAIAVISTVNCSADAAHILASRARAEIVPAFPCVDDVFAVIHKGGCGIPIGGSSYDILLRCLIGMATHPNVAAAVVVGLGCEVVSAALVADAGSRARKPCVAIGVQESGGVGATVTRGMEVVETLARQAGTARRTECPVSELVVGTNCGGSDAYSGITANPLLGRVGELIAEAGGGWALAESPETRGADHILAGRAVSDEVADRLLAVMDRWDAYTAMHGATVDNNPAPGNKEGGITTIYEKALGAVTKGGELPLRRVVEFAEPVDKPGLTFMDTPGMDDVSVTGLAAGGCNLIAFTTGRGSCMAFKPVPVIKIASTTDLYRRMPDDMDFNAGSLLDGVSQEEARDALYDLIISVASGTRTAGERQGLGEHTFAPWDLGPTL